MIGRLAALGPALATTARRRRLLVLSALLGTGAALAAIGLLTTSGYLISRAAQRPEILSLTVAIVGVRFFGTIRALLRYGERLASHELAFGALADLRARFFRRLIPQVPTGLDGVKRGDLLRRFVGDVDRLQDLYLRALTPPIIAMASGLIAVAVATIVLPVAGLTLAVALLLGGLVAPALTRLSARRAGQRQAPARAALSVDLLEAVEGGQELYVAGRGGDWLARIERADGELRQLQRRDALSGGLANGLSGGLAVAAAVAVTAVAIPAVASGQLNGVMLAALALLALASFEAITPLGLAAASLDACASAAARVEQVVSAPPPVSFPAAQASSIAARSVVSGTLSARGLAFGYEGQPLFAGLDFDLAPGTATALVGASGCGKSSLAELLVRFRDPWAGQLTYADRDLSALSEPELRATVRLASQSAHLFTASLRENVAIGDPTADDEAIRAALAAVGLADWLDGLPEGLDSFLGEAGATVSGGQRQRIAAARVLVSSAPVRIFDEPTAHLDPAGAAELLATLTELARERGFALLVISHELPAPWRFDRVIDLASYRP